MRPVVVPSPSCPLPLAPAHPSAHGQAAPCQQSVQQCVPWPRGGPGPGGKPCQAAVGTPRAALASGVAAGPPPHGSHLALASLTPTQRSAIGERSTGVIAAQRDCCKVVAARHSGGGGATSGGAIAQSPPRSIVTCTSIQPSGPPPAVSAAMCAMASSQRRTGQQAVPGGNGHTHRASLAS